MPEQAVGSNGRVIYGLEDSLGAGAAAPNGLLLYHKPGETFGVETADVDSDTMRSNPNPTESLAGDTSVKGGFPFELSWQQALLLAVHFGSVTTGAAVGGVFTEVFKIGTVDKSLWFEKGFPDLATPQYFGTRGHRIAKYSYDRKGTGFVGCSFDIPGIKEAALATASYDTTPVDLLHAPFNSKLGSILIDTVDVGTITSAKFDSTRTAKPGDPVIGGGGYSSSLPVGKATVKGSITTIFDSVTLYNKARSRAVVAIKLTDINGTGDGTAGNESIEHYFPETHLSRVDPTIKGDDGVIIDFPFTAFHKSDAGGSPLIVTVKHASTVLHDLIVLAAA